MFRGRYEHAMDGKGRVSLPARFREAMAEEKQEILVATTSDDPCLAAFTLRAFEEFEGQLAEKNSFNESVRRVMRHYVGNAQDCPIDGMGRVLIPPALREYAGLEKDVVFVGQVSRIEIWSKERWENTHQQTMARLKDDLRSLSVGI